MSNIFDVLFDEGEEVPTLPNPIDYYFYYGLKKGIISLNIDIDEDVVERVIYPLKQMDEDSEIKNIVLYINSGGGEPYIAMSVVSCLENIKTPVTIHILGRACSAACYIAMAKGPHIKTVCDKYSIGLIHAGTVNIEGDARNAKDTQAFLDRYEMILKDFVCSHTNISEDQYEEIDRKENWLTADEMLEFGIVDEII